MSKRITGFLISLITIFNIAASMSVFASGQATISIEGPSTAKPGDEVIISVTADIAAATEIQGIQLIFDYSANFPTDSAVYTLIDKPESWSNTLINSYSLTGLGAVLSDGGKLSGQIKFNVPENAQNGEVYKVSFGKCKVSLSSSLLAEEEYTIVNNSVEISVEAPEDTFTESVVTDMSIVTGNGETIEAPEDLTAGEYNVILNISNITGDSKQLEAYVAVKVDERLYSVKKKTATLNNSLMQIYSIEIPVTLARDVNGMNVSVEAYCWDNNMVPFSEKLVFGNTVNYIAYGRITATDRTDSELNPGYVKFSVEESDNFDGKKYGEGVAAKEVIMKYSSDNVYNEAFRYAKAVVVKNLKTDAYEIVSLKMADSENVFETSADLYIPYSFKTGKISFYEASENGTIEKVYNLSETVKMYINGVEAGILTEAMAAAYLDENDLSGVTLRDATGDGFIDYIFVDYYVDAIVSSVIAGDGVYTINFTNSNSNIQSIQINTADVLASYTLDGEEIDYTDLKHGDVVSVAYDVTGEFWASEFYDMLVSRDTVTGMVTQMWPDELGFMCYTINGNSYKPSRLGASATVAIMPGNVYTLRLNVFGRFASCEAKTSASEPAYTGSTPIALCDSEGMVYDEYVGTVIAYNSYEDGELNRLKAVPGAAFNLIQGDIFLYETDSNGYVKNADVIFSIGNTYAYTDFMRNMTSDNMGYKRVTSSDGSFTKSIPVLANMPEDWLETDSTVKTGNVDLIYGVITDRDEKTVSLAQIEKQTTGTVVADAVRPDKAASYYFASDVTVYVCDFGKALWSERLRVGSMSDIIKTDVASDEYVQTADGEEVYTVLDDGTYRELNFMFGKVVDGKITECVVILGSN